MLARMPGFQQCWRCQKRGTAEVCARCQVAKYCSRSCRDSDKWRHESDCDAAAVGKTCRGCKTAEVNVRRCCGCYQAYYCSVECQKKNWKNHKPDCKSVEKKIVRMSEHIAKWFSPFTPRPIRKLYYWGNYPAYDYLNLEENEGCEHGTPLNVLVLGVGDLRNVALTCASLPRNFETEVKFTLNDIEPCTLARLVLLLFMLIRVEAGRENQVTEVWYSMKLGDETYQSLCSFLRELSNIPSSEQLKFKTNGLLEIHDRHLNELKAVWKAWLDLPVVKSDWITELRSEAFEDDPGSEYGRYSYYQSIPSEHVKSAKQWMMDGVFVAAKDPLVAENPTMTGTPNCMPGRSYSFCFDSSILPFKGWDYLKVKKFKHCNSLVEMYTAYVNDVLRRAKGNLASGHICIKAVLADCFNIKQYLRPNDLFDRILTSNLSDHVPLTSLLKLCSKLLKHSNPYATIVTETLNWISRFCPDASVENSVSPFMLQDYVVKDTGSRHLLKDFGAVSYIDYHDNSDEFIEYLRATFHALSPEAARGKKSQSRCSPPFLKQLGNEFQLQLRDFLRNENRIAFFKMALNCRRPTMLSGDERVLEWKPWKND